MSRSVQFVIITAIILAQIGLLFARRPEVRGQLSAWAGFYSANVNQFGSGIRYIPELNWETSLGQSLALSSAFSVNAYWQAHIKKSQKWTDDSDIKPYRLWLRLASAQFEMRVGLQKINFGPARLLRSLMWFDRIDPRDPLGLTDGVYAVLARYYFLNNANIWLWLLYGNENRKGQEVFKATENTVESGGRMQYPLGNGEVGLTLHFRKVHEQMLIDETDLASNAREERLAVDGIWDIGAGVWFELAVTHNRFKYMPVNWRQSFTVGTNYTWDLGNGLHTMAEHLILSSGDRYREWQARANFSGIMASYPVGLLDQVSAIILFHWNETDYYSYISWQRIYNNLMLHFSMYWNPESSAYYGSQNGPYMSKGFRIMLVYNH